MRPNVHPEGRVIGQVDALEVPRFAGPSTFARLPRLDQVTAHDVAVVGVPFDSGVSYRPGARFGPSAVRQGSRLLKPYNPAQDVMPFAAQQVVDAGDIACNPFDISAALGQIETGLRELTGDGAKAVTIGGDHTIALPALRAAHALHGPIALIHFDAHLDTWDTYFGEPYTHGTPFRRAAEEGLLLRDASAHVGIRGPLYDPRDLEDDARFGFTIVHCAEFDLLGARGVAERVRARVQDAPVYVSVDIDVLDPAHAPGTGTPEIGGMTGRELLTVLRGLSGLNIIGGDVVETSPAYDHAELTSVAAATVVYEILSLLCPTPR
ncbi:agmatinase [Actinocorallia herbida]|uniref:Agmatinase n=1 Tax=Actinocorallia herbida TaxID=58109 RepID=A0A3N1CXQ2_9ACTN|nr:agmatinase [Actinocorallia herbida]ROO86070.1 agmatinase [Actinocorallia herbida]